MRRKYDLALCQLPDFTQPACEAADLIVEVSPSDEAMLQ